MFAYFLLHIFVTAFEEVKKDEKFVLYNRFFTLPLFWAKGMVVNAIRVSMLTGSKNFQGVLNQLSVMKEKMGNLVCPQLPWN